MNLYMLSSVQQLYQRTPLFVDLFLLEVFCSQTDRIVQTLLLSLLILLLTFCQVLPHIHRLSFQILQILPFSEVYGLVLIEL